MTVYDADGQFLDSNGNLIHEPSQVISLIFEDTAENEAAIEQIVATYKQQFPQESVLQVVDEEIQVAFNSDTIFVNDREPINEQGASYDILLREEGQNSYRETITDFVAAEQILFPVASFENMLGKASAISLNQFTLDLTTFNTGDQFLTVSYDWKGAYC